jgi:predicted ribosome quality control (RQC) complex YloA/Tae2 family protein
MNSRILSFEQVDYERIIKLTLETKESKYELFIELFGKGNVIVVKDNKIVAVAEEQIWADRTVKSGIEYIYPKRENTKEFFEKQKQKGSSVSMSSLNEELSEEMQKSLTQNSAKSKEIKKIENIIEKQSQNLKNFAEEAEQSKKKGDLIYEKYQELNEITNQIKQMKGKSWDEIKKSLKKYKYFKNINEKEGTLVVDL